MSKKSIFSNLKEKELKKESIKDNSKDIDLILKNKTKELDLKVMFYQNCDINKQKLKERTPLVLKINDFLKKELKRGVSFSFIESHYYYFQNYVKFCDRKEINPFSKEGFILYCGNNGELRKLVNEGNNKKQYLFMYENNELMGLKESSANAKKLSIELILKVLNIFQEDWNFNISKFKIETSEITENPYSDKELKILLNRVQKYFYQLGEGILKEVEKNGNVPDDLVVNISNEIFNITSSRKGMIEKVSVNHPFNQFMAAGYSLLSFYTSFNDSSILDLRHPIEIKSSKKEGRVLKHATITAWKGRKKDFVSSVISDDFSNHLEIDKKSGLDCLELLVKVSKSCGSNENESLFFAINNKNNKSKLDLDRTLAKMSLNLNLTSENKYILLDYFVELFYLALDEGRGVRIYEKNTNEGKVVKKDYFDLSKSAIKLRLTKLSYLILDLLFKTELKNIIMPLGFLNKKEGITDIIITYKNGQKKEIEIENRYQQILEDIQDYSCIHNTYKLTKKGKHSVRTPYLIPFGFKSQTKQWDGLQPIKYQFLNELGINSGSYFLSINSRKMRLTNSSNIYKDHNGSIAGKVLLDHSQKTHDKHYSNGNKKENDVILFEGLNILNEIAAGNTKKEAVEMVKSHLNIKVLSFDEYKKRKLPTNINGMMCSGKEPDLISGKNEHNGVKKNANRLGVGSLDINCYQYDLCILCKNAKLVEDAHSVYKLLSFIDCLEDAADLHIEMSSVILEKAERFKEILESNISQSTIEKAQSKLNLEGRYKLLQDPNAVYQYI